MPAANVQVTLAEALEVRGGPLEEAEIWSVLHEAAQTLITLLKKDELSSDGQPQFIPSPDFLLLTTMGRAHFTLATMSSLRNRDLIPAEYLPPPHRFSSQAVNKMVVFCLGMTVYWAADYKLKENEELQITSQLDSVLAGMCEEDASFRMGLEDILEVCARHGPQHCSGLPFSHFVLRLHKLVLGSMAQLHIWSPENEMDSRGLRKSRNEKRQRSRSRSRSRSKDRRSHRPHPLGRDQSAEYQDGHSTLLSNISSASKHSLGMPSYMYNGSSPVPGYFVPEGSLESKDRLSSAHQTYARLVDRRRKLEALRKGLDMEEPHEMNSLYSEPTDFGESKSLISATSYTRGIFRPDQWQQGNGLQMGRESLMTTDDPLGDPSSWILKQEQDIEALRRAQEEFLAGAQSNDIAARKAEESNQTSPKSTLTKPKTPQKPKSKRTPRAFYGPEFILNDKVISLQLPEARSAPPNNHRVVTVVLLDGRRLNIECEIGTTAKELYDFVVSQLSLPEHFFFGLTFMHDDEYFFIEGDTKLSKIAPSQWKEPPRGILPSAFITYMRVKFYVDNINAIRHDATRHHFYLQLRQDIIGAHCYTNEEQGLRLSGLALQAEYEDWQEKAAHALPEYYLSSHVLRKLGREGALEKMMLKYKPHHGITEKQAETMFLKEAMQLPEYGIHFYKVSKSKKEQALPVWTGISVHGVLMADRHGNERIVYQRHPWHLTQKISFNKRRFSILPKSDTGALKLPKFNYYTENYKKGRYLLQLCTAHHRFEMMMRTRKEDLDISLPHAASLQEMNEALVEDDMEYEDQEDEIDDEEEEELMPVRLERPIIHKPPKTLAFDDSIPRPGDNNVEPLSDSLVHRYAGLIDRDDDSVNERRILAIMLPKSGPTGIGITIVGGENVGALDLGCFVESVIPGSPADLDGRIQPGDRIIAINGTSVEGMPHHRAVELIREARSQVELLISQPLEPMQVPDIISRESSPSPNRLDAEKIIIDPPRTPVAQDRPEIPSSVNSSDLDLEDMLPKNLDYSIEEESGRRSSTPIDQAIQEGHESVSGMWSSPEPALDPQTSGRYEVELKKVNNSLGLNVTGGVNTSVKRGGIFVKSLADRGAAQRDGRISIGDRVLEVNGVSLIGVTHKQAVETLRSAPQYCKLVMERQPASSAASSEAPVKPIPRKKPLRTSLMSYYSFVRKDNTFEVKLPPANEGRGMTLSDSHQHGEDSYRFLMRVKEVIPGGTAEMNNIEQGDVILAVNGQALKDFSSKNEALEVLNTSDDDVMLLLCRLENLSDLQQFTDASLLEESSGVESPSMTSSSASTVIPASSYGAPSHLPLSLSSSVPGDDASSVRSPAPGGPDGWATNRVSPVGEDSDLTSSGLAEGEYEIRLTKGDKGLGFTLAGGQHTTGFFYVKEILYEPALSCHSLVKGHRLIRVNNNDLTVLQHKEAIELLRTASGSVLLRFCPPDDDQLSPAGKESTSVNSSFVEEDLPHEKTVEANVIVNPPTESNVVQFELIKPTAVSSFGFSLIQGERGNQSALFVKSIAPGGLAEQCGQLKLNDRLIQVNDESVIGMVHNKVVALIKASGNRVRLTLTRSNDAPNIDADEEKADQEKDTDSDDLQEKLFALRLSSHDDAKRNTMHIPMKPPRSSNRLPISVTEQWFQSLPLLEPPSSRSVLYTGSELLNFIKQLQMHIDNDYPQEEFKKLKYAKLTDNCIAARRPENKNKNRYRNVLPYDANRVKLAGREDYMNASHVKVSVAGGRCHLQYIACQGPLPNTTSDFWRMVFEQKVQVIAMVTQETEAGRVKCHHYWPDINDPIVLNNGQLRVTLSKQTSLEHVNIAWINVHDSSHGQSLSVMHLNFTTWPDHGAPLDTLPLLQYIRMMHLCQSITEPGPVLVHCSAGIGRTGALITIDIALNMICHDAKVDIQKIVQDLRRQRQGMIQTKDQYTLCYRALYEAMHSLIAS